MALIEWADAYRTGNVDVDLQHERLFSLLNRLHDRIMVGQGVDAVADILVELTEYVLKHFHDEEVLMLGAGYPAYEEHHVLHVKLVEKVDEFRRSQASQKPITPLDLVRFLSAWIQYHILLEDVKLVRWLEKHADSIGSGSVPAADS